MTPPPTTVMMTTWHGCRIIFVGHRTLCLPCINSNDSSMKRFRHCRSVYRRIDGSGRTMLPLPPDLRLRHLPLLLLRTGYPPTAPPPNSHNRHIYHRQMRWLLPRRRLHPWAIPATTTILMPIVCICKRRSRHCSLDSRQEQQHQHRHQEISVVAAPTIIILPLWLPPPLLPWPMGQVLPTISGTLITLEIDRHLDLVQQQRMEEEKEEDILVLLPHCLILGWIFGRGRGEG